MTLIKEATEKTTYLDRLVEDKFMRRKRGFTLVELIAALAILSIGLSGILFAFSTAVQTRKNEDIKLDTGANAQVISENLRAQGKVYVEEWYKSNSRNIVSGSLYMYIFFDNAEELNENLSKGLTDREYIVITSGTGSYAACASINAAGHNKTYGARLQIADSTGMNQYSLYKVNVTVWNLKFLEKPNAEQTFYIGS